MVAMATMTFQNGAEFAFKLVQLAKYIGNPRFVFHQTFLHDIILNKIYGAK